MWSNDGRTCADDQVTNNYTSSGHYITYRQSQLYCSLPTATAPRAQRFLRLALPLPPLCCLTPAALPALGAAGCVAGSLAASAARLPACCSTTTSCKAAAVPSAAATVLVPVSGAPPGCCCSCSTAPLLAPASPPAAASSGWFASSSLPAARGQQQDVMPLTAHTSAPQTCKASMHGSL